MGFDCRIYGMELTSTFELTGVAPGERAVRQESIVDLVLESPGRLDERWSGPATPGRWRGRLRDGAEFSIRWGKDGDLLFGYDGERATFLLDPETRLLSCAPVDPDALDWQRVLLSRVLPLVAVARGAEALHAGAVEGDQGAVVVAAPSGGGKSTLIGELVRRGSRLLADDILVLSREPEGVRAHPASPHLSLADRDGAPGLPLGVLGGKHWIGMAAMASDARPVAAVAILDRSAAPRPQVRSLDASPLTLAPFMLGLPDEGADREATRFDLYADLVEEARLFELAASPEDSVAAIAEALEAALVGSEATL